MEIDRSTPVLVTGANGYIASWLVKQLLDEGVDVHGTVRDPDDPAKTAHLRRIADGAAGRLTLYAADLLDEGAFDEPMRGCGVVFHTASPFVVRKVSDAQRELIEPALQGTRNVLEAAGRTAGVRRVVLTSSAVAVYGDAADLAAIGDDRFTEEHWNFSSTPDHQPYSYSKTVAERCAWEIAGAAPGWDLVVVNPAMVFGPALSPHSSSESVALMKDLATGLMLLGAPDLEFGIVDVRDVAAAHIRAAYLPHASGRHLLVRDTASFLDIARILKSRFGGRYPFPRFTAPKAVMWLVGPFLGMPRRYVARNVGLPLRFDNSRARADLQIEPRPVEETVVDHFRQMLDDGMVKRKG